MSHRPAHPSPSARDNEGRLFIDRQDAGKQLGALLEKYGGLHALVLALPRGGVPVAAEIARHLGAELDVLSVRKLGAPGQEELAIGAVTADGTRYVNDELVRALRVSPAYLDEITQRERDNAVRRELRLRAGLPQISATGRIVILVDDGLATGATMRAAVIALRQAEPSKLIVAVPVAARDSCSAIDAEVDELVCAHYPEPFHAVGLHYADFRQTSDEEVIEILQRHHDALAHGGLLGYRRGH